MAAVTRGPRSASTTMVGVDQQLAGTAATMKHEPGFCTIDEALDELRAGRMIVLVDDEHRENEGDLVMAAEHVTPAGGQLHGPPRLRPAVRADVARPIADRLGLELLPGVNLDPTATPFTHNFDARYGVTTGISAFDRCRTIQVCADPRERPERPRPRQGAHGRPDRPARRRAGPGRPHRGQSSTCAGSRGSARSAFICEVLNEDGIDGPAAGPARRSAASTD